MQRRESEVELAPGHCAQGCEPGREAGLPESRDEDRAESRAERLPEGRLEGRMETRKPGRADGLRAAVLAFARARLAPLSSADAEAIAALSDELALTELVDTLAQAPSVGDARAVLEAAISGTRR